jgi:hypothetical protein
MLRGDMTQSLRSFARPIAAALLALGLAACATTENAPPPPPPPSGAVAQGATILGRTALEGDGARETCAGLSVALLADTPAARRRAMALYGSIDHAFVPAGDVKQRAGALDAGEPVAPVQTAQCDKRGEFIFNGVPGGDYFVVAHVWIVRPGRGRADDVILQRVRLHDGQTKDLQLAP